MEAPGQILYQKLTFLTVCHYKNSINVLGKFRPQNWMMIDNAENMHERRKVLQNNAFLVVASVSF